MTDLLLNGQIEDYFPVPTRTLSTSPKTLASASTPLPLHNSISFLNDDNEINARRSDVFASDVVVSHPLRIGVGYGSYVCYSCTIYSSKVRGGMLYLTRRINASVYPPDPFL
jgi:hypothetical protein